MSFPINNGDFHSYVSLPEGKPVDSGIRSSLRDSNLWLAGKSATNRCIYQMVFPFMGGFPKLVDDSASSLSSLDSSQSIHGILGKSLLLGDAKSDPHNSTEKPWVETKTLIRYRWSMNVCDIALASLYPLYHAYGYRGKQPCSTLAAELRSITGPCCQLVDPA